MAVARVVSFDGVSSSHMADMAKELEEVAQPDWLNATEQIFLYDPEAERALVIIFFDDDATYQQAHDFLEATPSGDTPGRRTSVGKYHVAGRMTG